MSIFKKIALVFLIALVICGGAYWKIIGPKLNQTQNMKKNIESIKKDLVKQGKYLKQKELNKAQYPKMIENLKNEKEQALNINQRDELITKINSIVNSDIDVTNTNTSEVIDDNLKDYIIYPTRINAKGNYTGVINFIKAVNNINYLIRIERMSINFEENNRDEEKNNKPLNMKLKIHNYIKRPKEGEKERS